MANLEAQITALWESRDDLSAVMTDDEAREVVHEAI